MQTSPNASIEAKLDAVLAALQAQASKPMTLDEAASFLDLSKSRVYQMTCKNLLPHYKSGGGKRLYFEENDLRAWMLATRVQTVQELDKQATNRVVFSKHGKKGGVQ